MTKDLANMNINLEYKEMIGLQLVIVRNSKYSHSLFPTFGAHTHVQLKNILVVPNISRNLISIFKLLHDNNINIFFITIVLL